MGVIAKGIPRGCQSLFTPVSLGYPLSVFNKNSTLKGLGTSKAHGKRGKMEEAEGALALVETFVVMCAGLFVLLWPCLVTRQPEQRKAPGVFPTGLSTDCIAGQCS